MASTILNESGKFRPDVIERQLAHCERNEIRGAYNRAEYLVERHKMMQAWANYLDQLKADLAVHGPAINQLLRRNEVEANALSLQGTPGIVVGKFVVYNIGDLQALETAIDHARKAH